MSFISSSQKGLKNTGWDFSIGGSTATGTVRSVLRPPQIKDKNPEGPLNQSTPKKNGDSGYRRSSASGSMIYASSETSKKKDASHFRNEENNDDVWYSYPFLLISW